MPYLVLIGHIPENKSGVGARGYHAFRRGTKVTAVWGPIDVVRTKSVRFEWNRTTMHREYSCRSMRAAVVKLHEILAAREHEGYHQLEPGSRIFPLARAASSTPRR
jgi:hypothetical protein